ncbi:MAG: pyridoxamine 5'-phosphate oxidase family protein [Actinomycetota bacterium]|nr:pyridoxamine 5'-phosphate oxidase family protein [Actinomycetota bacterium]MDH4353119.1 pyridoxamine 5'-phosphate oxidase family protein [Actinomycetota bacterium]MDH5277671.1 pyridoxamine 5'-phosphate oxidase family protein [Actinomycetota bacterium]
MSALPPPGSTERTAVRRIPDKEVRDREVLNAVLDAGLVAHVAVTDDDGQPFVVPVGYARDGDRVLVHGSTASRLFRRLAGGQPTCLTVTLLDGLVLARSTFESSMNYRAVMVLGTCTSLAGPDKDRALEVITEHLLPGRWADARHPSRKESAATTVLALPLDEASVKVSAGPPEDDPDDVDRPVWAGVVPIVETFGQPEDAPDLVDTFPVPDYVARWRR